MFSRTMTCKNTKTYSWWMGPWYTFPALFPPYAGGFILVAWSSGILEILLGYKPPIEWMIGVGVAMVVLPAIVLAIDYKFVDRSTDGGSSKEDNPDG